MPMRTRGSRITLRAIRVTWLRTLPQSRQHFQSAVAVGGQQPHLELIIMDRSHGVVADAPVIAAGVETGLGEAGLHLLYLRQCQRAFRTGKWLQERRCAQKEVAEGGDRQRGV